MEQEHLGNTDYRLLLLSNTLKIDRQKRLKNSLEYQLILHHQNKPLKIGLARIFVVVLYYYKRFSLSNI